MKLSKRKSDTPCILSPAAKDETCWWRQNIQNSSQKVISSRTVHYIIHTDASNLGWRAYDEDQTINGRWSDSEKTLPVMPTLPHQAGVTHILKSSPACHKSCLFTHISTLQAGSSNI